MQGLLLLLACVKIKSNKYFMACYRNLVNIISQPCLHDIRGETLEVHPRSFCSHEHKARLDVPRRPARQHTFGSQRLGAWLECNGGRVPQGGL